MRKEMVGDVPGSMLGMLADLCHKLRDGTRSPEELERFLKGQNSFEQPTDLLAGWQDFYQKVFGLEVDFSGLAIPAKRKGFDRLPVVAQGITPQRAYEVCARLFPCWKWTEESLDKVIDFSFQVRSAKDGPYAYAIWLRDRVEADDELKDLSADALLDGGVPGITLEERLVYELKYFKETGKHLDVQNATLCSGSRYRNGNVPMVYWHGRYGKLRVDRRIPGDSYDSLCSREVVS